MSMTANEFLLGGGATSAKFPTVGSSVTGRIVREPEVQQQRDFQTGELKTWNDGKPMQQLQVVLATDERDPEVADDDGERAVYVKGNLLKAVREAIRKAGAKGLDVGGTLTVTYSGDGEVTKRGFNPPKLYTASYVPPVKQAATEFVNGGQPAAAPAQPVAQPVPATQPATTPAGVGADALAALQALTPEQRAALGL